MLFRPLRHLTLATFMPAPGNQRARAEGIRFVRALRPSANALVIAGRSGTGKTHLLHALAHLARHQEAPRSVACLSSDQFTQEVMRGQVHGDLDHVMDRLAAEDLLAVDDVDRLTWHAEVADALLDVLLRRGQRQRRSVLTAAMHRGAIQAHPLIDFLDRQPAVDLALTERSKRS